MDRIDRSQQWILSNIEERNNINLTQLFSENRNDTRIALIPRPKQHRERRKLQSNIPHEYRWKVILTKMLANLM